MGFTADMGKHQGLQENSEIRALWLFCFTSLLPQNSYLDFDFIYGEGFSYAIGTPSFEQALAADPSEHYHFLSSLLLDFDFYIPKYSNIHLFYRIHHRSGVFGLMTPETVRVNFVGFGAKFFY